jgi:hypothetical protein
MNRTSVMRLRVSVAADRKRLQSKSVIPLIKQYQHVVITIRDGRTSVINAFENP